MLIQHIYEKLDLCPLLIECYIIRDILMFFIFLFYGHFEVIDYYLNIFITLKVLKYYA